MDNIQNGEGVLKDYVYNWGKYIVTIKEYKQQHILFLFFYYF